MEAHAALQASTEAREAEQTRPRLGSKGSSSSRLGALAGDARGVTRPRAGTGTGGGLPPVADVGEGGGSAEDEDEDDGVSSVDSAEAAVVELDVEELVARGYGASDVSNGLILRHLKSADCTASDAYKLFKATLKENRSLEFYLSCGSVLIQRGEPLMAEEILYTGTQQYNDRASSRLRQLHAVALARCGSTDKAINILKQLKEDGVFDDELGGLLARCYKDKAGMQRDEDMRKKSLDEARQLYLDAFEKSGRSSYYTGINAATMALLVGRGEQARGIAEEVVVICEEETKGWLPDDS